MIRKPKPSIPRLRTAFMGTPEFAVPCLEQLFDMREVEIVGVVTQPDKRSGRGQHMASSPVKQCALRHGVAVYQPPRIKELGSLTCIQAMEPELIVVVAYGQILPPAVLNLPRLGCVNVHASLLPKYRGAAPMQWALINGEAQTGVTTMMMDTGLDTGDMLMRDKLTITPEMTMDELHDAMMPLAASVLRDTVKAIHAGTAKRIPQYAPLTSHAPRVTVDTALIDWRQSASDIHNLVRAMDSHPGAWTTLNHGLFKFYNTRVSDRELSAATPGQIIETTAESISVATGDGSVLEIREMQVPGKRRMKISDYLRGNPPLEGIFDNDN